MRVTAQSVDYLTHHHILRHVGWEPTYSKVAVPTPTILIFRTRPIRKIFENTVALQMFAFNPTKKGERLCSSLCETVNSVNNGPSYLITTVTWSYDKNWILSHKYEPRLWKCISYNLRYCSARSNNRILLEVGDEVVSPSKNAMANLQFFIRTSIDDFEHIPGSHFFHIGKVYIGRGGP